MKKTAMAIILAVLSLVLFGCASAEDGKASKEQKSSAEIYKEIVEAANKALENEKVIKESMDPVDIIWDGKEWKIDPASDELEKEMKDILGRNWKTEYRLSPDEESSCVTLEKGHTYNMQTPSSAKEENERYVNRSENYLTVLEAANTALASPEVLEESKQAIVITYREDGWTIDGNATSFKKEMGDILGNDWATALPLDSDAVSACITVENDHIYQTKDPDTAKAEQRYYKELENDVYATVIEAANTALANPEVLEESSNPIVITYTEAGWTIDGKATEFMKEMGYILGPEWAAELKLDPGVSACITVEKGHVYPTKAAYSAGTGK